MGRIDYSNGNRVNHVRKIGGEFLRKQDAKSRFFSEKMNNGDNIQEKTTQNIGALPDIPAILDYALNPPSQGNIKYIDGSTPHTLTANALLTFAGLFSMTHPKTTVPPREAILIDNPNSLLSRVTSPTKVNTPVLFGTTPSTTSTSQNHNQPLIRKKDGLIRHDADGNIILGGDGKELTFSYNLDIKILKKQLTNNINITKLCLWALKIDPQEVQEIGEILKDSNVKELSILHGSIRNIGAIDFGTMLTGTKVTILNLPHNGIGNKVAKGLVKSLKETNVAVLDLSDNRIGNTGKGAKDLIKLLGETNVKALDLSNNNMSDEKVNKIIPELKENTKIIALGLKDTGIERNTLKEVSKVLKQNRHVNKKSYIKSSPTEEESTESSATKEKSPNTSNKREKRDVHTTDETSQQETTVLTTDVSSTTATESTTGKTTVPTTLKSSTTTTKSTASSTEDSTTTEQETTASTTEEFNTTTMKVTTSSPIEDSTTTKKETTVLTTDVSSTTATESTTGKTTVPTTLKSSTTTTKSTASSTEDSTTTEQETTVPTTLKSSTTTTKSTASSTGNPTTDSATVCSNPQKTTTPKKNLTEKPEPIAADVVVDSITEKHTPKESNPNNPASSTMSIGEISGLISFAVTTIGVGGGVVIYAIKKFCGGVSRLGYNVLALADLAESDNCLNNNHEETPLAGVTVDDNADI